MESNEILTLFRECHALLEGHFELSSGRHSEGFLQCALVLQHPAQAGALGEALARRMRRHAGADALTAVLSPAMGGVIIGHEVGRALGVRALFAERRDGVMMLRRGFALAPSDRVAIVEDVVTTGGSIRDTIAVAREAGAEVVAAGAIVDRSGGTASFGMPFEVLAQVAFPTYDAADCPPCRRGVPAVKPGSRA